MIQLACEQEMNFQDIMMQVMAEEYMYLRENGEELVTESLSGLKDKFKQSTVNVIKKAGQFFSTVSHKLSDTVNADQAFVKKYGTGLRNATYDTTKVDPDYHTSFYDLANFIKNDMVQVESGCNKIGALASQSSPDISKIKNEIFDARDTMESFYKNQIEKDTKVTVSVKECIAILNNKDEQVNTIKRAYTNIVKMCKSQLSKYNSVTDQALVLVGKYYTWAQSFSIRVYNLLVKELNKFRVFAKKLILKAYNEEHKAS